ncbi:hypothetical protein Taro_035966 [Colocasia esculenta]|uniref:Uncharacterized protein n=1 Tax=Colocasia esculenta TaxID=4460 RepID=A0A843WC06_COLES|nr:hypothetical protein [Colocasia esculenta]
MLMPTKSFDFIAFEDITSNRIDVTYLVNVIGELTESNEDLELDESIKYGEQITDVDTHPRNKGDCFPLSTLSPCTIHCIVRPRPPGVDRAPSSSTCRRSDMIK